MNREFKILLIDDDPIDQMFLKKALLQEMPKLQFTCASSGVTALQILEQGNYVPDLIITDLNMPGVCGKELLEFIKRSVRLRRIPVMMMSSSKDQLDVDGAYDRYVSTYIQKPNDMKSYSKTAKAIVDYWCNVALLPSN